MKIDWDKAPEGATHYLPESITYYPAWMKKHHDQWWFVCEKPEHWHSDDWGLCVSNEEYQTLYVKPEEKQEWDGVGLPPVGTKCQYSYNDKVWFTCEVTYVVGNFGVVALCHTGLDFAGEQVLDSSITSFKPILSPEQSKKQEAIQSILKDVESIWCESDVELAEKLFELGYEKREGK